MANAPIDFTNSPCSEVSSALNEPTIGTAPQVGFWIMLEVRETWEPKNLEVNSLPPAATDWLDATTERAAVAGLLPRVQFIRHRRKATDPLTAYVSRDGKLRQLEFHDYATLANIDPLSEDIPICEDTVYFVCTHARRDLCCSRNGLPAWQKLDQLSNGRTWQTTHLGGHRFAPNVLVLPTGHSYGRVFAKDTERFFDEVESGGIPWEFLRGNSAMPPEAQVCEQAIMAQDGRFLRVENDEVVFTTPDGTNRMAVPESTEMEILPSCGETTTKTVKTFAEVAAA